MPEAPDVAALQLLIAIAEHGSLGAAARSLGLAQPNASRSLSRLERHTGVTLVRRTTSGSVLSAEGLIVLDHARRIVNEFQELDASLASMRHGGADTLRVIASQTVAEHLLPQWLGPFGQEQPTTRVGVTIGNTATVLDAVRTGTADLGFTEDAETPRGVNSLVVAQDQLCVVVRPGHEWSDGRCVDADTLATTPLVTREPGSGTRNALAAFLYPRGLAAAAVELNSNAAVKVSAAAGTGPAVLSRLAVGDALRNRTLVEVACSVSMHRDLRAVWSGPRRVRHRAAAALITVARRPLPEA